MRLVFDIETNGLLPALTKVHCICWCDLDNPEAGVKAANGARAISDALDELMLADELIGQNIIEFDIPALQKVYGHFRPSGRITDTKVMSQYMYPNMADRDFAMLKKDPNFIEKRLIGRHSLEAWGQRLGFPKDDYAQRMKEKGLDPWAEWNQDMEDYCVIDVEVTRKLYERLASNPTHGAYVTALEHAVAAIIWRQQQRGFCFDERAAGRLYAQLVERRDQLVADLKAQIRPWWVSLGEFVPKRDDRKRGYLKGSPFTRVERVEFNPASHEHIARVLTRDYGWTPTEFTDTGKPMVSETVLSALDYPPVKAIQEYLVVEKLIGQLAEGTKAWLKLARNGRIHGSVNTNGAVTGRMTHSDPNVAQVPRVGNPYGFECRSLFGASEGNLLVGCDAEGLELRALGHYMARYDGGVFARAVVEGKKEDGTDAHTLNQKALGLRKRDSAKTWIYAYIYGAGPWKLGLIVWEDMDEQTRPPKTDKNLVRLGKRSIAAIEKNMPALADLSKGVKDAAKKRGYLLGLDGRRLYVRSSHAALNTLLQSAGAVIMKRALVELDEVLQKDHGLVPGRDYEFVANVHDEFQVECQPAHADLIGQSAAAAITSAGMFFNLRCPMAGAYAIGNTWADTH